MIELTAILLPLSIAGVVIALCVILATLLLPHKETNSAVALREMVDQYAGNTEEAAAPSQSLATRVRMTSSARTAQILANRGWTDRLKAGLTAAGMTLKPEEFVLITLACGVGGAIGLFVIGRASVPAAVLGLFIGLAVPPLVMRVKANRRQAQFLYELPDTLSALASSLTSGASLTQALDAVARESSGPMQEELQRVIIENRLGTSVPDALEQTAIRMNCGDLQMVVMAIRLQSSVGGNLSTLLKTVANTLRERVKMARHVKALSAEGRMSLWVLMALPIVVAVFSALTRPEYFQIFYTTVPGVIMLVMGILMMIAGYLWARSIVKVEV